MSDAIPVLLDRKTARLGASGLAGLRVAVGVGAALAPRLLLRSWVGPELADVKGAPLLGRSIGGRDLALGIGALIAIRDSGPARGWIEAGALADTGDAIGMLLTFRQLPERTRWPVLAFTLGAIIAGGLLAPAIDQERR
jgi:hypothetical protein